ncbi:MAG: hypothetical protein ABIS68_00925 [Casimicrobiaceae bacterium]
MALKGHAFLALWNDITRQREPEYDQWHTLEHVPERVAVTGIHEARRYVNRQRERHRYFTLYDCEDMGVFESPEYVDLLQNPTPWSTAMRPDFSNFVRAPCAVRASHGIGIGAAIACLCVAGKSANDASIATALAHARTLPRITATHWGTGAGGLPTIPWKQTPAATASPRVFDNVLLIEALDRAAAEAALSAAMQVAGLPEVKDFGADVYDLTFVFPGADQKERTRHRRPGWNT